MVPVRTLKFCPRNPAGKEIGLAEHALLKLIQPLIQPEVKRGELGVKRADYVGCSVRIGSLSGCGWTDPARRTASRAGLGARRSVIRNPVLQ